MEAPDASETVPRIVPVSTCAQRGFAPQNKKTRLARAKTVRPNTVERPLPFIAFLPGPHRPLDDKSRTPTGQGGQRPPKRSSTHSNFADRGLIETRGKLRPTTRAL